MKLKKSTDVVFYRVMVRQGAGTPKAELRVRFTAADGREVGQEVSAPTSLKAGSWSEISLTAATPADAKNVQVSVHVLGNGAVDVDDIAPNVRQQQETVPNGGAESTIGTPLAPAGWAAASTQWEPVAVPNSSAEQGSTSPDNWKTFNYATPKSTMVWDPSVAHTGSKSLRIDGVPGGIADWQQTNYVPVTPGIYKFGFWVKGQNAAAGDIRPLVIFRNANGQTVGGDRVISNTITTADWTYVESTLTAPAGAVSVRIDYRLYNGGTAWFDDVSIARQVTLPGVAAGNTAGVDTATAKSGENSLTLANKSDGDQSVLESAAFPVERLAGYDFSAMIKAALDGGTATAGVKYLDANGKTLSEQVVDSVQGTTDWHAAGLQAFPPAAATEAQAFVRLKGRGQAWFDDLSLVRSTVIDPAAKAVTSRPSLLLGSSDVAALRERVKTGVVGDEYQRQLALSKKWSVEQLKDPTYLANPYRAQSNIYTVPTGATKMRLTAELAGKGSTMADALTLTSLANGQPVTISDNSFEAFGTPASPWSVTSATPGAAVATSTEWAAADTVSLRYAGAAPSDKATIVLNQDLPATAGARYSLGATISQRGLIEGTGLTWTVSFTNDAGAPVGAAFKTPAYNWDTHTRWDSPLFEATQANANVYLVTGDETAAQKAILGLKYLIGESIWGMDYALSTGGKPNGEDGYGAVHFGRAMGGFAQALDLVMNSKSMGDTDRAWLTDRLGWMQDTQMNQTYYDRSTEAGRISNWNLDRAIGVGLVSMALPNLTSAETYRAHAQGEVEWTLQNVVGDDGAFPETVRYHAAPLVRLVPFVQALKRAGGADLVNDPKLKKMFTFLVDIQTPVDSTNTKAPGTVLMPAIGDADYNEKPYRILGWNAALYKDSDPALSGEMEWTWQRAGSPITDTGANPWTLPPLLNTDPALPAKDPGLTSSAVTSVGYDILRNKVGTPDENYLIMSDTPRTLGHNHDDRSGFSLWGKSVPLALDSGTGGYFNGDNVWFNSAAAHNVVQFQSDGSWQGTAPFVQTPVRYYSEKLDLVQTGGATPGATDYQRNMIQLKGGFNAYLVWDRIKSTNPSRFNLHTLTTSMDQTPGLLVAHGYQGVDLDVHLLGSAQPSIALDKGRVSGDWPQENQQWLQLGQPAGTDHTVLLQPRAKDAKPLETIEHATGSTSLKAFELVTASGERAMIVLNSGDAPAETDLGLAGSWSAATPSGNGSVNGASVSVSAHQALVLMKTP
ncbi:heparinase II/III-like protein [Arthrobacter sp. SLBN-112]|uniref:heparinase II/III domain-containing protein n=1 Tax=Arthrobacter sp. SLBN-112 TaxID=2768452 RepID=UPI00114F21A1|nr:heparinase II/III family protein [Arthrobacter sp. SLBN-112]TQJ40793.1 heparinase II/III-like protein [Arthrobacter sp. SLBN-112]